MRNFKKSIITLILASAMTITGVFATNSYKNSLMSLDLESGTNGAVTVTMQTKKPYQGNINTVKRDATTYVIMLPEFNSSADIPNLTGVNNITGIKIDTRPYASSNNGYTKITITTNGKASIFSQTKVFVPNNDYADNKTTTESNKMNDQSIAKKTLPQEIRQKQDSGRTYSIKTISEENKKLPKRNSPDKQTTQSSKKTDSLNENNISSSQRNYKSYSSKKDEEVDNNVNVWSFMLLAGAAIGAICLFIIGRNKMADIVGTSIDIRLNDEESEPKKKVKQQPVIKNTIVSTSAKQPLPKQTSVKKNTTEQIVVEKMNVIDLDELFNAQSNQKQKDKEISENEALEDFLSNYYSETTEKEQKQEIKEDVIDEELYNGILNNKDLSFSNKDIDKMKVIMNTELTEDIKLKINNSPVTKPIKKQEEKRKQPSLESIISDYFTKQDIVFTGEDIKIIRKLMSVELNPDFITDLRIKIKKDDAKKFSIEETQTVTVPPEQIAVAEKQVIKTKEKQQVETHQDPQNYNVSVLKVETNLPDLQDVLAHPEKYEEPEPEIIQPDEDALLQSLSNVQFKPFYSEEISSTDIDSAAQSFEYNELTENTTYYSESESFPNTNFDTKQDDKSPLVEEAPESVVIDNKVYNIKSSASFNSYAGCYLAENNNKYVVFSYVREKISKLKEYDKLKSKKISVRINETFENGNTRFLIKIGTKKFIADFDGSNITYVMDLC